MKHVFIEGIQGSGKSTLAQAIHEYQPAFRICREGDYAPVELAWCTWMTKEEYEEALERYASIQEVIRQHTTREGDHYIVTYTRIITDMPGFHKDMERYEIYNGRKSLTELEEIVLSRYRQFRIDPQFRDDRYLFECAFMQNIIEDLILFQQCSDDEIIEFYRRLFAEVEKEKFLLVYLYEENLEESIGNIRKERSDAQGNELWYQLMMEFLISCPYGRTKGYKDFTDLVAHLRHRQQIELRIIEEVLGECAVVLPAKKWTMEEIEKRWN